MFYPPLMDTTIRRQRLTKHFTFQEMTATSTGLPNIPDEYAFNNLLYTCRILESVRKQFKQPIPISSGFRSPDVNYHPNVGGSKNSYHLDGRAVDILTSSMSSTTIDKLETLLWNYNPIELIRYTTKPIIHVAF